MNGKEISTKGHEGLRRDTKKNTRASWKIRQPDVYREWPQKAQKQNLCLLCFLWLKSSFSRPHAISKKAEPQVCRQDDLHPCEYCKKVKEISEIFWRLAAADPVTAAGPLPAAGLISVGGSVVRRGGGLFALGAGVRWLAAVAGPAPGAGGFGGRLGLGAGFGFRARF